MSLHCIGVHYGYLRLHLTALWELRESQLDFTQNFHSHSPVLWTNTETTNSPHNFVSFWKWSVHRIIEDMAIINRNDNIIGF